MTKTIAHVNLEYRDSLSVRGYSVQIDLHDDGTVRGYTIYQRVIGGAAQAGVELKCTFNAKDAIRTGKMEGLAAKIASEANRIIDKRVKNGYKPVGNIAIDPVVIIRALYNECRVDANANTSEGERNACKDEGITDVEVVGMVMGVAKIAKVISLGAYEMLGELHNPKRTALRVGDVVKAKSFGDKWQLVC